MKIDSNEKFWSEFIEIYRQSSPYMMWDDDGMMIDDTNEISK